MKKLLIGILVILSLFALTACDNEKNKDNVQNPNNIYEDSNSGEESVAPKRDLVSGENDEAYKTIDVIQLNGKNVEIGRSFENVVDNWEYENLEVRYTAELKLYIDEKEALSFEVSFFNDDNACIEKSSIHKIKDSNNKEYLAVLISTYNYDFENSTVFVFDENNNLLTQYIVYYSGTSYFKDNVQLKYEINEYGIVFYESYIEDDILNKCQLKITDGQVSEEIIDTYKISDLKVVNQI